MRMQRVTVGLGLLSLVCVPTALARQSAAPAPDAQAIAIATWSDRVWDQAREKSRSDFEGVLNALSQLPAGDMPALNDVSGAAAHLKAHLAKREADRGARLGELNTELEKALAQPPTDAGLSKALRSAVELEMLSPNRSAVLREARMVDLVAKTDEAARAAEKRGDWLMSRELFVRLHALLEESGVYKKDVERVTQRLAMLMLYVPETLWKLRNDKLVAAGEDPLPAYNPAGNDYNEKLRTITDSMVLAVLARGAQHVDQAGTNAMLLGGLEALRTMVTTPDLRGAFPKLDDAQACATMLGAIDREEGSLKQAKVPMDLTSARSMLSRVGQANESSVKIPRYVLLHEFGNGLMTPLDEFSAIIWPDELRRFQRTTQGRLVGVGVQIEFDAQSNIKVVAPIDGSPAQRVGIRSGDIIKKVDGTPCYGMSLDQAVDLITGAANTGVELSIERENPDRHGEAIEVSYTITREQIDLRTVKGWKRTGPHEDDWDYFVDKAHGIGYVRLTQFTDTSTREFDRAVRHMQDQGLKGLVLDLRFNPGGLLEQAVSIVQRFVPVRDGIVVMMSGPGGTIGHPEFTDPGQASLSKLPVVVLVNENSASASEIVSGALRYYGRTGDIRCLVLGERSYGKGSVQNVWEIPNAAMMKLTIQYYMLPDRKIIHRRVGAETWGVDPDVRVEMLPRQQNNALAIRRNAELAPQDWELRLNELKAAKAALKLKEDDLEHPAIEVREDEDASLSANPDDLLAKGIDLQVETAVVLLQSQVVAEPRARATAQK